jgi:DNA modification methylase
MSSEAKQQNAFDSEEGWLCECGAWKGELGQEPTPGLFVSHVADVMGEVLRVLKSDGSLWLNTASTYSRGESDDWPEKELIPVPWMLGLEMHRRGWRIRADVQWWKVNPKRDSAKDRPARCHEYVTMFTKGPNAYYNEEGVRQPYSEATLKEIGISYRSESKKVMVEGKLCSMYERANAEDPSELKRRIINSLASRGGSMLPDVWYLATGNGEGRHVAVFPEQLPELCITAGSRPGDIVLDPFAGSGTTLQVARRLGRRSIGIELSQESVAYMGEKLARPQVASLMGFDTPVEE